MLKKGLVALAGICCVSYLAPHFSWAAACCARSSAAPTLILSEDRAQLGLAATFSSVVATADDGGAAIFGSPTFSELIQNYRLEGATLLTDRLQVGASFSVVQHTISQTSIVDSTASVGDTRISLAYEVLPLWTYSKWRPQAFLFSVISLPTGRSVYEQQATLASDVGGNGFYAFSVGTVLQKRWDSILDAYLIPEIHYSLPRAFDQSGRRLRVVPGGGLSVAFGLGLSPNRGDLRLGLRVQPRFDQGKSIYFESFERKPEAAMASCDVGVDISYLLSSAHSLLLSYTDQTLLGPAMNSDLNRSVAFLYQHRWER